MSEEKRIIEINGVKMEIDTRTATVVETYKVGQSVKVLKKYYDTWRVQPGVIIGFVEFKALPTIEVLTVSSDGDVQIMAINGASKDVELAPTNKYDTTFDQENVLSKLNRDITSREHELAGMIARRDAFIESFGKIIEGAK